MGLLMLFLIITDVIAVTSQRNQLLEHTGVHFVNELDTISIAIREPLLRQQYDDVEQFLLHWGKEDDHIIGITGIMPNGFELVQYKHPGPSVNFQPYEKRVQFAGKDLITLRIVRDFSGEEKILDSLQMHLITGSTLLTVIFGSVLWLTLQKTAVKPLEREITIRKQAEEMLQKAKDHLETRVRERTKELRNANEGLLREINERRQAEAALRESHERLITILDSLNAVVYVADMKTYKILFINKYARDIFGDVEGELCWQALQANQTGPCEFCSNDKLLAEDGEPAGPYNWELQNTVNGRWYYLQDRAIYWVDGRLVRINVSTDIMKRKKTEEALRESEEKYRNVVDNVGVGIALISPEMEILSMNNKMSEWFPDIDVTKKPICFKSFNDPPREDKCSYCPTQKTLKDGLIHETITETPVGKDVKNYRIVSTPLKDQDSRIISSIEMVEDVTEMKRNHEEIKKSLREKELLLREIYHRVKNNMQVISSLLNFQSEYFQDEKHIQMFKESQSRIKSMALVHEKLYQSKDLTRIDFKDYITGLLNGLFVSYSVNASKIALHMDIQDILLGIDTAIPCGLIINELLTNSLKHAFPEDMKGEIHITFRKTGADGERLYELIMSDSGVGIPKEINIKKTKTLGLHLVTILVENQLQGELNLDRTDGTSFRIFFKEPKYSKRI